MFEFLYNTTKTIVSAPVAIVSDVLTLGGLLTDKEDSYTEELVKDYINEVLDEHEKRR